MSHARKVFREGICWGAALLFAAVALPVAAIAAIVLRPVLLIAAAVAGVGVAVLYCVSARFRDWLGRRLGWLAVAPVTGPLGD